MLFLVYILYAEIIIIEHEPKVFFKGGEISWLKPSFTLPNASNISAGNAME